MIEWNRRGTIVALTALAAALLVFGAALARALTLEPVMPAPPVQAASEPTSGDEATPAPLVPSSATLSAGDIALAVDHDPFQPDRTRPAPFRLPGEDVPSATTAPELPAAPEFTVTGLVQSGGGGGLALIQAPDQTPLVIGVGESVLGYRLERVGATSATLVGNDGRTLELQLAAASPEGAAASSRNSRNASTTQADAVRAALQRRGITLPPGILQGQRSGMTDEQLQALRQQMGGRGARGGRVTVRRDTTEVPIRIPDDR